MHLGINGSFIRKRMTRGLVTIVIRITHYYGTVIYIFIYKYYAHILYCK